MVDYKELYIHMIDASEKALEELSRRNYAAAAQILIAAERECEERYIEECAAEA